MVRAVIQIYFDVDHWIACQDTGLERFAHAFFYGWNVLTRYGAADDCFREGNTAAEFARAEFEPYITVLTVAAALFFVFAFNFACAADCFAVSDFRFVQFSRYAEFIQEFFQCDIEMRFADAAD